MPDIIPHEQQVQPCPISSPKDVNPEESSVPLPPGLRDIRLSDEAAAEIRKILEDESHPTHVGREMPAADPAILLRKVH